MKMTINFLGDDLFLERLFSCLYAHFSWNIHHITPIRNHVFMIETAEDVFILKGYPTYSKLKLQETFTTELKKEGFQNTYSYLDMGRNTPFYFDHFYYGIIEYIPSSKKVFTYMDPADREEGLSLLKRYHHTTENLVSRFEKSIRGYQLLIKWKERRAKFIYNLPLIEFFIEKEIIEEIMDWANWSLRNLESQHAVFQDSKVILHGDVAHHNFLRSENENLYLIDFDLISMGDPGLDYLQYANRILPFLDWSLEQLSGISVLERFLHDKIFLYGLAFPTDIFREWNRIIKERQYQNPVKVRAVVELTKGQFFERKNFIKDLSKK